MICLCGHPYLSHESGECTEKGCPCVKWEEVAEGPTYGFLERPMYAVQGGGLIGDPFKDITARQTNIVGDRFKKEWRP